MVTVVIAISYVIIQHATIVIIGLIITDVCLIIMIIGTGLNYDTGTVLTSLHTGLIAAVVPAQGKQLPFSCES